MGVDWTGEEITTMMEAYFSGLSMLPHEHVQEAARGESSLCYDTAGRDDAKSAVVRRG